jgi:hypothetical protein
MPKKSVQIQDTITISAHQRKTVHNIFSTTVEFLEKYIEIADYYDDWEQRKQIHNNEVVRKDIIGDPEKAEKSFSITLFGFRQALENKPKFFRNELKEEFYRWISATGIDAKNAHPRLKNNLFGFHEILEGRGEKIMEDVLNRKDRLDINSPDYAEKLNSFYAALQVPLEKGREQEKLLKDKTYRDIKIEKKFGVGDDEQGKHVFNQITESIEDYQNFHHFKQQGQQSHPVSAVEVVREVKSSPQNWVLDEIITEFSNFGEGKQEIAIYCQHARLDDYLDGKLNFNNNPIYRWENFNSQQRFEIKQAKNISGDYLTNDEIKWVVREVKENPRVWTVKEIDKQIYLVHTSAQIKREEIGTLIHSQQKFSEAEWAEINEAFERAIIIDNIKQNAKLEKGLLVINLETGEHIENEDWFIHNSLEEKKIDDKTGYLIYVPNAMIRVKDLTEAERKELGLQQKADAKQRSHQVKTDDNRKGSGKGDFGGHGSSIIFGSFTVISLIGLAFTR